MKKYTYLSIIFALAIFGVATYVIGYSGEAPKYLIEGDMYVTEQTGTLGAISGPDVYQQMYFYEGAILGGATTTITATTSATDVLLTAAQVCKSSHIELNASIKDFAFTLTLPTASLLAGDCFNRTNGMSKKFLVRNNSGANATVTAGTGGVLLEPDGENVVIGTGNYALIDVTLINSGKAYVAVVEELIDAD
jgi:hypothetical protein